MSCECGFECECECQRECDGKAKAIVIIQFD